jgi:hypothetical protein
MSDEDYDFYDEDDSVHRRDHERVIGETDIGGVGVGVPKVPVAASSSATVDPEDDNDTAFGTTSCPKSTTKRSGRRRLPRYNGEIYPSDLSGTSMMEMFAQMKKNYGPLGFLDTCNMVQFQTALCCGGVVKQQQQQNVTIAAPLRRKRV